MPYHNQFTRGYASFIFYAWGYASRKRLGTAEIERYTFKADKFNSLAQQLVDSSGSGFFNLCLGRVHLKLLFL